MVTLLGRVAEVGRLSANAKNAFNSFVSRVFANWRQKVLFLRVSPKLQQKRSVRGYKQIPGKVALFFIFLNAKLFKSKAQTTYFLHFFLLCIESGQKEVVMHLKLNKSFMKTRKSLQNIFF